MICGPSIDFYRCGVTHRGNRVVEIAAARRGRVTAAGNKTGKAAQPQLGKLGGPSRGVEPWSAGRWSSTDR